MRGGHFCACAARNTPYSRDDMIIPLKPRQSRTDGVGQYRPTRFVGTESPSNRAQKAFRARQSCQFLTMQWFNVCLGEYRKSSVCWAEYGNAERPSQIRIREHAIEHIVCVDGIERDAGYHGRS